MKSLPLMRVVTMITALVILAGVAGFLIVRTVAPNAEVPALAEAGSYSDQPTLGSPNAPVKIIMFENFMCEHCKALEEESFTKLKRDYIDTGKVQVFYVNLAWGEMDAVNAGLAGECAYRQDELAFWDYKTMLYRAQGAEGETWATIPNLVQLAADNVPALDAADLRVCIEERRYEVEVERDLDLADYVGVQGTPSLVVGDEGFQNPPYSTLAASIDRQLASVNN